MEELGQIKERKWIYSLVAFLIPSFMMIIIYKSIGIYPFGDKSILTFGMRNRYISYFAYLKEMLKGEHSFWYTFSKTLGEIWLVFRPIIC